MSKSTGSEAFVPATIERTGMVKVITVSDTMVKMPRERSQAYEWTSKINREDKLSGSYERYTAKEKASRGEPHVEKGTGRVAVKDEFQKSTTVKFGNKNGYREYHIEERLRDVNFGTSSNGEQGPNKYTTRDESDSDNNEESDSDESDSDNSEEQGPDKCSTRDESDSDSDTEGGYSYESDSDTDGGYNYSYDDSDDDDDYYY